MNGGNLFWLQYSLPTRAKVRVTFSHARSSIGKADG